MKIFRIIINLVFIVVTIFNFFGMAYVNEKVDILAKKVEELNDQKKENKDGASA